MLVYQRVYKKGSEDVHCQEEWRIFCEGLGIWKGEKFPDSLHLASMIMANQPTPPNVPPPRNEGLIRPY